MQSLVTLKTLSTILEDDSWCIQAHQEDNLIVTAIQGDKSIYRVLVFYQPESDKITYQILYQFSVPEEERRVVAEAIARFNYSIGVGSLFLDFDDGQVGFKHCLLMEDNGVSSRQFVTPLYIGTSILDFYYPGFQKIVYGGVDPADVAVELAKDE